MNTKPRIWKGLLLSAIAMILVPPASAVLDADLPDPVGVSLDRVEGAVDTVRTCTNQFGELEVYDVVDHSEGQFYSVFILKEVGGNTLRAAWNSQLGRTVEGINTYLSFNSGAWTSSKAFEQGQTGACGEIVGFVPSSGTVRVKVHFGGLDYTIATSDTTTYSLTVSVGTSSKFGISLDSLGVSRTFDFGASGTWTASTTTTVTIQGTHKTFISGFISSTTVGPIEDSLNQLQQ